MAKKGLIFYQSDTDRYQDMKIKRLKKNFSCSGVAIWDYVLNEIYRVEGSFLVWNSDCAFDVSDYFGIKESLVNEVINYCSSIGLLNKELLRSESVLTSKAIQLRYINTCKKAKRKNFEIPEHLDLLREEKLKVRVETPKVREVSDIVEYSKVKNSREDVLIAIKKLSENYLNDEKLIKAMLSNKDNCLKNKTHLEAKLTEFLKVLTEQGRHSETWGEFTKYFRNWLKKTNKVVSINQSINRTDKIPLAK